MRPESGKKKFILSHLIFLLSLIVIYFLPRLYPVIGEKFLPPTNRILRFYIIGVFSVTFLAYYLCLHFYNKSDISVFKPSGMTVYFWASTIFIFLILCSSSALLSHDLFEYSIRARMLSVYQLNPYLHTPTEVENDIFFPLIFWKSTPECYGPLWVSIGAIHTLFFKNSIALTSFMHKFVLLIFLLFSSFVFYKLCKDMMPKAGEFVTLAFLLNPLILIMTIVDGHNEIAMIFFILCAFYLLIKTRIVPSFVLLALAIAVKFVYVILLPIFILYTLGNDKNKNIKQRVYAAAAGVASFIFVTVIAWLPFRIESVKAVFDYYKDLSRIFWSHDTIPYAVYRVLGKTGVTISENIIANLFILLFIIIYLGALVYFLKKTRYDKQSLFTSSALILLALLFTNSSTFQTWYLIWAIPFILLSKIRLKFHLVFILSYFLIMIFWKRMVVLAIPTLITYLIAVLVCKRSSREF